MKCETCNQRKALIHLGISAEAGSSEAEKAGQLEHHFCLDCADEYFSRTPGRNPERALICLSDWYRSKLYDQLEMEHPEAFDNSNSDACIRGCGLMRDFLNKHLTKAKIELNDDAFEMLCIDFYCSHHFYARADAYRKKKG
jgi:hypothetical protein